MADPLDMLREALRVSPENIPLRLHLARSLLDKGRFDEAVAEYKDALARAPHDVGVKLGLASAYFQSGKDSHSLVIVEDLLRLTDTPGGVYVLHAKLLARAGDVERAVRQYKRGVEQDSNAADSEFAMRYGIQTGGANAASDSGVVDGRMRREVDEDEDAPTTEIERPKIQFQDVGGMDALKEEIRMKIIHPMAHPELYKAYGKSIGGGILMYGPPGCGKTHLARATAGEIKAGFMSVGISDVLDMWIGRSEKNLHALFDQARRNKPCVLFFDEVDALAASRTDMRQAGGRHVINQFLSEMDGVEASNDGVLILAATNAPWHLDNAFRRPGRFDRILFVPPPDAPARAGILRVLLKDKPQQQIDHDQVAKKTDGFSGADLKAVLDLAIERKLQEAMKSGLPKPLVTRDLLDAAAGVKPSTREWFASARNYALYANQGGAYDDVLKYLKM
jgi:transitional endoplasmic reticulum ATPase